MSFIYVLCHKLWLNNTTTKLAMAQFYIHQLGTVGIVIGLFLLYGNVVPLETIDPFLAVSTISVFVGMVLMKVLFIKSGKPVSNS